MKNLGTLKVTLPSDREVRLTRVFDAPRAMVYEALTQPALIERWFGPHGFSLDVCEVDLREGGRWRYVIRGPDGKTMGMGGKYIALTPPDGLVHTEAFDDFPGEARVTTLLTEANGKTTLEVTSRAPSKEIRDALVASGMEHGAAETYDRLAELLVVQLAR
jgi:uncharacterized protein YndB with AHSA1/START domain